MQHTNKCIHDVTFMAGGVQHTAGVTYSTAPKNLLPQAEATAAAHACCRSRRFFYAVCIQCNTQSSEIRHVQQPRSYDWMSDMQGTETFSYWLFRNKFWPIGQSLCVLCKRTVYDLPDWLKVYSAQLDGPVFLFKSKAILIKLIETCGAFCKQWNLPRGNKNYPRMTRKQIDTTNKEKPENSKVRGRKTISGWSTTYSNL